MPKTAGDQRSKTRPMNIADDRYCLAAGAAKELLAGAPSRRFVVLGDSIAAGLGDQVDGYGDRSWADRGSTV